MKVVIAGSRSITDKYYKQLLTAIEYSKFEITEVVSGCAIGVDKMGEKYARCNDISVKQMPADWNKYGKSAGPIRNKQMADYTDAAIILWDGKSAGTSNMISNMTKLNKPLYLYRIELDNA